MSETLREALERIVALGPTGPFRHVSDELAGAQSIARAALASEPAPASGEGLRRLTGDPDDLMTRLASESRPYFVDLAGRAYIRIRTLQAALASTATPPEPGLDAKYVAFVERAAKVMVRRLDHGRAKWGVDWDEQAYRDEDNLERLRRAVDHLEAAHRNSPDPAEWQKRAADVANQAFMFADPDRLRASPIPEAD